MNDVKRLILAGALLFCLGWLDPLNLAAATNSSPPRLRTYEEFAAYAKSNYTVALKEYQADQTSPEIWRYARACFDLADYATNSNERAELAQQGIAACRQLLTRDSHSAAAHYYLAMNMGQLARTKSLGALRLVDQMEVEFSRARELDAHYDHGGPDRCLGLLYRDAPSIGSIGSRSKARHHLTRAAVLAPQYPDNRLNLIEAFLKWGDRNGALRELKALEEFWVAARATLIGPAWASSWSDWEKRLQMAKKKIEEPSKAISSPRGKD